MDLTTEGLPEEVLAQLKRRRPNETDDNLVDLINDHGKEIDVDGIIILYYRRHAEALQRTSLVGRLRRLANADRIHQLAGRKGVYVAISAKEDSEEEEDGAGEEETEEDDFTA